MRKIDASVIQFIQAGRGHAFPVAHGDHARQNDARPAYVKAYVPDELVKAMNGSDERQKPMVFIVVVPPEPLIVAPGIIVPGVK